MSILTLTSAILISLAPLGAAFQILDVWVDETCPIECQALMDDSGTLETLRGCEAALDKTNYTSCFIDVEYLEDGVGGVEACNVRNYMFSFAVEESIGTFVAFYYKAADPIGGSQCAGVVTNNPTCRITADNWRAPFRVKETMWAVSNDTSLTFVSYPEAEGCEVLLEPDALIVMGAWEFIFLAKDEEEVIEGPTEVPPISGASALMTSTCAVVLALVVNG
eukprot:Blabericola_migrator_1__4035@NODE_2227_length_3093_cov_236_911104_g1403_i0_p2_GENE_NODE_2227_length_3093_cov_236_911104_g1403_i0NODE_2227_length_3093_cov_236_911104_g1403_i0_p2_ORF_typecomplete_len221_score31_57_NODE_2227_length_3093_cov_236_911104_g1403_i010741736